MICGLAASLPVAGLATPALARGMGEFRSLKLSNWRTEEKISCVYWADGEYIPEALAAFNYILRDWRQESIAAMDPNVIDILAKTQAMLGAEEGFEIVSGYRTAATNAQLRRRSRGVARKSFHMRAMAVDIAMKTRSARQISRAGVALGHGGVGRYSRAEFVHLDSGPVRQWGR
ncbi:MAG: DUF882 domain-containing protein [Pseudomonadota bacterium]